MMVCECREQLTVCTPMDSIFTSVVQAPLVSLSHVKDQEEENKAVAMARGYEAVSDCYQIRESAIAKA